MRSSSLSGVFVCLVFLLLIMGACSSSTKEPADPLVAEGKRLFDKNCTSCHSIKPNLTITGPSLYGLASRAGERMAGLDAREYLYLSITAPGDFLVEGFANLMKADFAEKLSADEINSVIAYLMTLE